MFYSTLSIVNTGPRRTTIPSKATTSGHRYTKHKPHRCRFKAPRFGTKRNYKIECSQGIGELQYSNTCRYGAITMYDTLRLLKPHTHTLTTMYKCNRFSYVQRCKTIVTSTVMLYTFLGFEASNLPLTSFKDAGGVSKCASTKYTRIQKYGEYRERERENIRCFRQKYRMAFFRDYRKHKIVKRRLKSHDSL